MDSKKKSAETSSKPPLPNNPVSSKEDQAPTELPKLPADKSNIPSFNIADELPSYSGNEISSATDLEDLPTLEIEEDVTVYDNYNFPKKPLYIRTDRYSQIISNIDTMKQYIDESTETIYGLKNLKRNQDVEHKNYKQTLENIQRKLIYVDKLLFKA